MRRSPWFARIGLMLAFVLPLAIAGCGSGAPPSQDGSAASASAGKSAAGQKGGEATTSRTDAPQKGDSPSSGTQGKASGIAGRLVAAKGVTSFDAIHFFDAKTGWALTKSRVLRTQDGGASWTDVTPKIKLAANGVWSGDFVGAQDGWIADSPNNFRQPSTIYRTTDGGAHWQATRLPVAGAAAINFQSASQGVILLAQGGAAGSEGVTVLRSSDGGATWKVITSTSPLKSSNPGAKIFGGDKTGAAFSDPSHGWVTGTWPGPSVLLYHTADGGKSWSRQTVPVPHGFSVGGGAAVSQAPQFFSGGAGVLPVIFQGQGFVLYRTQDGGRHWSASTPIRFTLKGGYPQYSIISSKAAVVADATHVFATTDGGRSWTTVDVGAHTTLLDAAAIDFVSPSTGWALVPEKSTPQRRLYGLITTRDGGRTWSPVH